MKLKRMSALLAAGLLMSAAQAENYRWDSVAMGGGGYVSAVVTSKSERNVMFARTDVGGAYRWDAGQARWIALNDWVSEAETGLLGIESLAIDPNNAAKVYMLAGTSYFNGGKTAILRSTDYGKHFDTIDVTSQFKAHGNGMGRQAGEKLQVDPGAANVLYVGTRRNGLFKSVDSGSTWSRLAGLDVNATPNDNGISFVLLDPTSVSDGPAERVFVGVSRIDSVGPNLYMSLDSGQSFIPLEGGPVGLMPLRAVMSPDGLMYITYANGAGPNGTSAEPMDKGQVWEYDAAGGAWTNITPNNNNQPYSGISLDPNDPRHLVTSTINTWWWQYGGAYGDHVFTSRDAGRSWTDVTARGFALDTKGVDWSNGASIHWTGSIEFDPFDTRSVLATSGNGIYRTANIDAPTTTWGFNVAGIEETVPLGLRSVTDGPLVSVIGDYDGFVHTDPSQYGVMHAPRMGSTNGLTVAALDQRIMARAGSAIYTSHNGGSSWNKAAVMNGSQGQLAYSANGAVLLHSPANSTTTYRSTNDGASWSAVAGLAVNNARPEADPVNPLKFYVYDSGAGRMMVSLDGGASFSAKGSLASGGATLMRALPGREGDLLVCLNGGGLVRSTDSGTTFSKVAAVSECGAVGFGKGAAGSSDPAIYLWGTVATERGVLRSTDMGATWVRVNDAAHQYGGPGNGKFVTGDMNTFGVVYMSSVGRGIAYGKPDAAGDVAVVPQVVKKTVNECTYVVTAAWSGGYNALVRITNKGTNVISGWTVNWTYTDNSSVQGFWNAAVSGVSPNYSATNNQSWNHDIYPGGYAEFGMTVAGSVIPKVTGAVCE